MAYNHKYLLVYNEKDDEEYNATNSNADGNEFLPSDAVDARGDGGVRGTSVVDGTRRGARGQAKVARRGLLGNTHLRTGTNTRWRGQGLLAVVS